MYALRDVAYTAVYTLREMLAGVLVQFSLAVASAVGEALIALSMLIMAA